MSHPRVTVVALSLAAVFVLVWWAWLRPDAPPAPRIERGVVETTASTHVAPESARADAPAVEAAAADRVRAAPVPANGPADGTALVRVVAQTADGRSVPNVMIQASRIVQNRILRPFGRGLTDAQGRIEFAGVEPGKLRLRSDRGDYQTFDVVAGDNDLTFTVEPGVDVVGRVLDPDGTPVGAAEVWLQTSSLDWDSGRVLGTTANDGSFALADVPAECSLGAFARGFAPSALVDLDEVDQKSPPARVELVLQPDGGALVGRVTDADDKPIARAHVAVGARPQRADRRGHRFVEQWTQRVAETDADGRYALSGLRAGPTPVAARGASFGIWRGDVTITAGGTTTLDVRLERAGVLFGTVTDGSGAAEAEARVSAFDREPGVRFLAGGQIDFDETFDHVETVADDSGRYRLDGVTPGTVWLIAQRKREQRNGVTVAFARTQLELLPGTEQRWDAVIDVGRSIEGLVRYRDGHPAPHLFITLVNERSGHEQVLNSGRDGVFRFLCLEDGSYGIRVQPPFDAPKNAPPPPPRDGVVPDRGRVEFRLDYDAPVKQAPGTVTGRIDDIGGRIHNPEAATVTLHSDAGWFRRGIKVENAAFRVEGVKPCRFRVSVMHGDTALAQSDWFDLAPAGNVDIGVLATETAGALRILASRETGTEHFEPRIWLRRANDVASTQLALGRRDEVLIDNLTPGAYEISGYLKGMVNLKTAATVAVGQTTDVTVELRRGGLVQIDVFWPEQHSGSTTRGYRITDAAGKTVAEFEGALQGLPTRPYPLRYTLAAGRYDLRFWTDDGLRGELAFVMPESLEPGPLRLDLK